MEKKQEQSKSPSEPAKEPKTAPAKEAKSEPTNCSFYLAKKRKYCKFPKQPNSIYCFHHVGLANTEDYVRCPADPKHFIKKADLEFHIKICSKTKQT